MTENCTPDSDSNYNADLRKQWYEMQESRLSTETKLLRALLICDSVVWGTNTKEIDGQSLLRGMSQIGMSFKIPNS
jgi:hypothetical protein